MSSRVPSHFAHFICACGDNFRYQWDKTGSAIVGEWPHRCVNCNKYPAYDLFKCKICDRDFYLDFRHPAFCRRNPTCWKCTSKSEATEPCYHYPPIVREMMIKHGIVPPVIFKEFTEEELADLDLPSFDIE